MSLVQTDIERIKYPPFRFAETRMIANLAATTRINYSEFTRIEPFLVWLREISFDRNANISCILEGTYADKRHEDTIAFGAAFQNLDDNFLIPMPFDFDARVALYNAAAVAVPNYQGRVVWEAQPYRVADKLSMGISYDNLDEDEKILADKYHLVRSIRGGKLPMEYPKGDLQYAFIGNYSGNPAANVENNLIRRTVPDGYKMVLTKLYCSHPAANFGDLEIRVYQDRQLVETLYPYCFPNYTTATRQIPPLELWIPAISDLRVALISTTGHAGILAAAECELRRLTIWDKIAWNLENVRKITTEEERTMISELDLRNKLNAGIYELVTPLPTSEQIG